MALGKVQAKVVLGYRALVKIVRMAFVFPIRLYQRFISPQLPKSCNYYPTCSAYAVEAVQEWGVFLGSALALWRLLRCNPFSYGGYDPVPKRKRAPEHDSRGSAVQ